MRRRYALLAISAVLLTACDHGSERAKGTDARQIEKTAALDPKFVAASNHLIGGETKADVVQLVGAPDIETVNCSKERTRPEDCNRKFLSLKYCFPDKASCPKMVEIFLNKDGHLFGINSDFPEIPSRSFSAHQPDWLRNQAPG